jgi:HSP20 family molecular chaperone IbpA
MPPLPLDVWIWEQARDLLAQTARIQERFLETALAAEPTSPLWPPVNVFECPEALLVIAALPGAQPSQVEVRVDGAELVIAGAVRIPGLPEERTMRVLEIPCRFERRLRLPRGAALVDARLEGGFLRIVLEKTT